jgi:hypothetical protein
MSKRDVSDMFTSMLGKPSGYRISFRRMAGSTAEGALKGTVLVGKGVKLLGYDIPKFILYDAAWGGFAEGLGIREPRELRAPWETEQIEEVENVDSDERGVGVEGENVVQHGDVVETGDVVERESVMAREHVVVVENGDTTGREHVVGNGGIVENGRAVGRGPVMERDQGEGGERVVAIEAVAQVSLATWSVLNLLTHSSLEGFISVHAI